MDAPLYNQEGNKIGTLTLPERLFHVRWNEQAVRNVILAIQANRRSGTAHTKGRGEVRGGGKKPWRQKGTGRARHGSIRSPLWVGGGVTHGPLKTKNYEQKINKQARRKALAMVLSKKLKDGEILFIDTLRLSEPKTKVASSLLQHFAREAGALQLGAKGGRAEILLGAPSRDIIRAFRNLPFVEVEEARNINAEKALIPKYLLMTQDAVEKIV